LSGGEKLFYYCYVERRWFDSQLRWLKATQHCGCNVKNGNKINLLTALNNVFYDFPFIWKLIAKVISVSCIQVLYLVEQRQVVTI